MKEATYRKLIGFSKSLDDFIEVLRKLILVQLVAILLVLFFNSIANAQAIDANNYVKIIPNATQAEIQLVFGNPINATYTVGELNAFKATQGATATASIVPHNWFEYFPQSNEVYLGNPVDGTFEINQLADLVSGASKVIADVDAERFRQMQQVFQDQKAILDNWIARQDRIVKVQQQMDSYIATQLNDMITIGNWLESNLGTDPPIGTDGAEPTVGQLRTIDGVLQRYDGAAWVEISNPILDLEQ